MKQILVILLALASLGFVIETPGSVRLQGKEEASWQKKVKRVYDLPALHGFLRRQISALGSVEQVDLGLLKIGDSWQPAGLAFASGHWVFSPDDVQAPEFTLSCVYERVPHADQTVLEKTVTLECRRQSKSSFTLVRAFRHEDESVLIIP